MRRKVIRIDHGKCNGCGVCASDCPEGALQVIDGKARLVGDLLCDGLGACLKSCPENAISVEEREADPYDELTVLGNIIPQGHGVILAHLRHLRDHGQSEFLQQALSYLRRHKINVDLQPESATSRSAVRQCPGSKTLAFAPCRNEGKDDKTMPSMLAHWPVQLHLISPSAPHYRNSDLLVAADCTAYSYADFHRDFLKGRTLAIACPKLDSQQEIYVEKLAALIDQAHIKSIRVAIMQVPCCNGLLRHVLEAASRASREVSISRVVVGIRGEILGEDPIEINPVEAFVP
jgi:NAD-dependent dihydropyrimidine dehydrogenase PreA subunit